MYKKKRYCTILRNLKKCEGGGGEGQYLNPKHSLYIYFKTKRKEQKKIFDRAEIKSTTSGLEKTALLSNSKKRAITQKASFFFF